MLPPEDGESRPTDVLYYADLMRIWATRILEDLVRISRSESGSPDSIQLRECWVGYDFHAYVCYALDGRRLGARLGRLDHDQTSGRQLDPSSRYNSSASSAQVASDLYHGGLVGGRPGLDSWTDPSGYAWWGETPEEGWPEAVFAARFVTVTPSER